MIINTAVGVQRVPQDYMNVARVLNLSEWKIVTKILFPAVLPYMLTGVRLAVGTAWLVIVAAEMLTGGVGIGFWVWDEWNNLNVEHIIIAIFVIGIVGLLLEFALIKLAHRIHLRGSQVMNASRITKFIEIQGVEQTLQDQQGTLRRAARHQPHGRQGRVRDADRPLGLRQVDAAEPDRRACTTPTQGALLCANREIAGPGRSARVVFQNHSLLPWLTCYENVYLAVERVFGATESRAQLKAAPTPRWRWSA